MIASERLYLTSDRRRVVKEGDTAAAFLLAAQGSEIPKLYLPLMQPKNAGDEVEKAEVVEPSPVEFKHKETAIPKLRRR